MKRNRFLSILLSLIMVLNFMPAMVFADDELNYNIQVEMPKAGYNCSGTSDVKEVDNKISVATSSWVPTETDVIKLLAYFSGDYSQQDIETCSGKFQAGTTYYSVAIVKFESDKPADPDCVNLVETEYVKQIGNKVVNTSGNEVIVAFSVTIPSITVTIDFGSSHAEYAATVAEMPNEYEVVMTVSGSSLTYKAEKGSDLWFDVLNPIRDALYEMDTRVDNKEQLFLAEGGGVNFKPLDRYSSYEEWSSDVERIEDEGAQNSDITLYVQWKKPTGASITITRPLGGTEVVFDPDSTEPVIDQRPEVTVNSGKVITVSDMCYWIDHEASVPFSEPFSGTMQCGQTYYALVAMSGDFGYYLNPDEITVKNGTIDTELSIPMQGMFVIGVEADHNWAGFTPVEGENKHQKVCAACGAMETEPHSWDAGVVTKEPTETETGERTYTCTICGARRYETIDKLPNNYVEITLNACDGHEAVAKKIAEEINKTAPENKRQKQMAQ